MREIVREALGEHVHITGENTDRGYIFFILHNPEWPRPMGFGAREEEWYSYSREGKIEHLRSEVERLTNE